MPITFLINPATISKFLPPLYNNIGFLKKKDCVKPSDLKIEVTPNSRFLKSANAIACKCCFGFGAKLCSSAASSIKFNVKDCGDYDKRVGNLEQKKALIVGESDTCIGSGGGHRNSGSGLTGGNDSGGAGENGGWETVKGLSWWIFDAWKEYNYQVAHPGSASLVVISRFVMPILQQIGGRGCQDLEALLMQLLMSMFVVTTAGFSRFVVQLNQQLMLLFATGAVGFVLIMSFLFWNLYLHYNM